VTGHPTNQWRFYHFALTGDPREMTALPENGDIRFATAPVPESPFDHALGVFERQADDGYVEVEEAQLTDWLPAAERRARIIFPDLDAIGEEALRRARLVWPLARSRLS
jgi:hypothetical protein